MKRKLLSLLLVIAMFAGISSVYAVQYSTPRGESTWLGFAAIGYVYHSNNNLTFMYIDSLAMWVEVTGTNRHVNNYRFQSFNEQNQNWFDPGTVSFFPEIEYGQNSRLEADVNKFYAKNDYVFCSIKAGSSDAMGGWDVEFDRGTTDATAQFYD